MLILLGGALRAGDGGATYRAAQFFEVVGQVVGQVVRRALEESGR